ncbi:hypothetical protein AB0A98_37320 [Streptomyces chrestomyceticus]|uniref:hypothetical protein n=1 Tax=Streptomyces chrestomyceticus TaxID=68185 RepID=UPI0033E0C4E9
MTEPTPDPAEQTATAVAAAFPGLRQAEPYSLGQPLSAVQLTPRRTARYTWGPYDVHVAVGPEDHLNREAPEDASLQRQVRARAALLATGVKDADLRGHAEWRFDNNRPEVLFPEAFSAAAADQDDPRFASAVLATVALALDYARIATGHAGQQAAEAAQRERERPKGVSRTEWMRQKQAERQDCADDGTGATEN